MHAPQPRLYADDNQVRAEIAATRARAALRDRATERSRLKAQLNDAYLAMSSVAEALPDSHAKLIASHKLAELRAYALAAIAQEEADDGLLEARIAG